MNIRFAAVGVTLVTLISFSSALFAQTTPLKEEILSYDGVGRIKWELPQSFPYYLAVPHFSSGPRIKCEGPRQDCEISVTSRDITAGLEERRAKLSAELAPYVQRSEEKSIKIRTFGSAPEVTYATLTDTQPGTGAPGEFQLLTLGFSVNGTAVIHFQHFSNDTNDIQKMLEIIQGARTMDARGIWAWKLKDYQIVCEARFPTYKKVNDAAFQSSPFSSVDIVAFWQALTPSESREKIQRTLNASRESYAKDFDGRPPLDKRSFCRSFPTWVVEAAGNSTPQPKSEVVNGVTNPVPLLDISMTSFAMGRTSKQPLYFRLYETGRVEFEVWQKVDSDTGNATNMLVKHEMQLGAPAVAEFVRLAQQPDFLNAPDGYSSLVRAIDWSVVTTVVYSHRGQEKRIVIRNYRPLHPKAESFYPKSLVKLLARVDELRAKD